MSLLPRAVLGFKRTRPQVSLQLQEGVYPDVLKSVRSGDLDFAICLVPEWVEDETVAFEILLKDTVAPAVRVGHPFERQRMKLADLLLRRLGDLPPRTERPRHLRAHVRLRRDWSLPAARSRARRSPACSRSSNAATT